MERDDVLENVLRLCLEKIREIQTSGVFGLVIFGCVIFGHFEEVVSFHGWFFFLSFFLEEFLLGFFKNKNKFRLGRMESEYRWRFSEEVGVGNETSRSDQGGLSWNFG